MKHMLMSTLSCLILFLPVSADLVEETFVPIGTRASVEDGVAAEDERTAFEDLCQEGQLNLPKQAEASTLLPYDYQYYAGYDHWAVLFSGDCRVVEIEDQSQWLVSPHDVYKTLNWLSGDLIAIHPNWGWFPFGKWRIVNRRTGESAEAQLIRSPNLKGPYTKFVYGFDAYNGVVYLTDGTRWVVSSKDRTRLQKWLVSDVVIVGMNDGFWSSSKYPAILINVNLNECVFAQLQ
jgi:hypothetical protein